MRRAELIQGVNDVVKALKGSNILRALMELRRRTPATRKEAPKTNILSALRHYAIAAHNYNAAAKQIAEHLNLTSLESPSTWEALINSENSGALLNA